MPLDKPSVPKGTRDFLPEEMLRRNHIFGTIRSVFERYGYLPIETPAMENLSTLTGKYGEEGDKLLFRILNSGDYLKNASATQGYNDTGAQGHKDTKLSWFTRQIAEKGLRYDLTVPLARFVVQHQHELTFPFKRYQIQPVWRADRPQKGRYREFYQCDVDVLGSDSLLNEVELIQIIDDVFTRLDIPVLIKINNRKILQGVAEAIGSPEKLTAITMAIDKLEKTGLDKVNAELSERGLPSHAIEALQPVLALSGKIKEKKEYLLNLFSSSETGRKGIDELCQVLHYLKEVNIKNKFEFDTRLARGLDYYTGIIIEVVATDVAIGSLCGGGRYDDLTSIFGLPGLTGVGISFGADRVYDVMLQSNRFPHNMGTTTHLLFINFGEEETRYGMAFLGNLRDAGINTELFPSPVKLKKQFDYANRKHIPWVALTGKEEMASGQITVKNMQTGEQQTIPAGDILKYIQ